MSTHRLEMVEGALWLALIKEALERFLWFEPVLELGEQELVLSSQ